MNVLMLGNCQSRPLAAVWGALRPKDNVASYEIHTMIEDVGAQSAALRRVELADVILHHPVSDDYPVEFARTSSLKRLSTKTRICVPMIFFSGLQPDMVYVGGPQDRILSPMGDYHSRIVLSSFLAHMPPEEALRDFESEDVYSRLQYYEEFERSLKELARRDLECDVAGASILSKFIYDVPTLFTINHPMNVIFMEIITAAMEALSLGYSKVDLAYVPTTLSGGPVWPPNINIHRHHELQYSASRFLKTDYDRQRLLSFEDFIWESYDRYRKVLPTLLETSIAKDIVKKLGLDTSEIMRLNAGGFNARTDHLAGRRVLGSQFEEATDLALSNPTAAHELMRMAIWLAPASETNLLEAARVLARTGDIDQAIELLRGTISNPAIGNGIRLAYIDFLLEIGAQHTVAHEIAAMLDSDVKSLDDLELVMKTARRLADFPTAARAALKLLATNPNRTSTYAYLAHIVMDMGQPRTAISAIEMAIRGDPANPHHYALRGYAFESLKLLGPSIVDYNKAVELEPTHVPFKMAITRVQAQIERDN